jgi:hypothetical protein
MAAAGCGLQVGLELDIVLAVWSSRRGFTQGGRSGDEGESAGQTRRTEDENASVSPRR